MTVGELIEMLEEHDRDSTVYFLSQPMWPFEYSIQGVTTRIDAHTVQEGDLPDHLGIPKLNDKVNGRDNMGEFKGTDVFLVEGSQVRYGMSSAWECV